MKKNMFHYALVLGMISLISASLLSFVHKLTIASIEQVNKDALVRSLEDVLPAYDNDPVTDMVEVNGYNVFVAKKNKKIVGFASESLSAKGYGGDVNILIGVTPDKKIYRIKILSHKETPGLGDNIEKDTFTDQFKNIFIGSHFFVKKDGGNVVQVSGATVSSRAVSDAIEKIKGSILEAIDLVEGNNE